MKHARRTDQPATDQQATRPVTQQPATDTAATAQAPTVPPQRTGDDTRAVPAHHAEGAHHEGAYREDAEYEGAHREPAHHTEPARDERVVEHDEHREHAHTARDEAHDKFGGTNLGAAFFGWLVAVGIAALLIGIIGAVATAVGANLDLGQAEATQDAGGYGLAAAIVLAVVLLLAYYAGGYVAGRMSRFDGARQGFGVWLVGLIIAIVVAGVGAIAGSQYDVFSRVDLPSIPLSTGTLTWGGLIVLAVVLLLTALAAVGGGLAGHRYHNRVDRAAGLR